MYQCFPTFSHVFPIFPNFREVFWDFMVFFFFFDFQAGREEKRKQVGREIGPTKTEKHFWGHSYIFPKFCPIFCLFFVFLGGAFLLCS